MLETLRQYAGEKLFAAGESVYTRERHATYYLAVIEEAATHLEGSAQSEWLARLKMDYENLRAALQWFVHEAALENINLPQAVEQALRLTIALHPFWRIQGLLSEGRHWLNCVLPLPEADRVGKVYGIALNCAGELAESQGDYAAARAFYQRSLTIWRRLEGQAGIAEALNNLGNVARKQGDVSEAHGYFEESLLLRERLDDKQGRAVTFNDMGNMRWAVGDFSAAQEYYLRSLELVRSLGNRQSISIALNNLGNLLYEQGLFDDAHRYLSESIEIAEELGDKQGVAYGLGNLGNIAMYMDKLEEGRSCHRESISLLRELGDQAAILESLDSFAHLFRLSGLYAQSVMLLFAREVLRAEIGETLREKQQMEMDEALDELRVVLGQESFADARRQGQQMSWDDAISCALAME